MKLLRNSRCPCGRKAIEIHHGVERCAFCKKLDAGVFDNYENKKRHGEYATGLNDADRKYKHVYSVAL